MKTISNQAEGAAPATEEERLLEVQLTFVVNVCTTIGYEQWLPSLMKTCMVRCSSAWENVAHDATLQPGQWQLGTTEEDYWDGKVKLQCRNQADAVNTYCQCHNLGLSIGGLGGTLEIVSEHLDFSNYTAESAAQGEGQRP